MGRGHVAECAHRSACWPQKSASVTAEAGWNLGSADISLGLLEQGCSSAVSASVASGAVELMGGWFRLPR